MKCYAKIYCEEGVVLERKFATAEEATAFVDGFYATLEAFDSDDDFLQAATDDKPSEDELTMTPKEAFDILTAYTDEK